MQQKPVGPEIHQTRRNAISVAEDAEAARQAAEASRTQYEQVVSMISDVVWRFEVDGQGQFVNAYISPVADRLLGLPAGTIGNSFDKYFSYVYPEELPALQKLLFSGLRGLAKEATAEYRMRKLDGTTIWVRSKGAAYPQPDGHIVGYGTASDISDRKWAEETLQQYHRELKLAAVQVKDLMTDVVQKNVFTGRFDNPSLTPCWEATKCDNTVCPSYRNYANLRCWEVAGTLCRGKVQGRFAQKLGDCSLCEVYQRARANPIVDLGETFNAMIAIFKDRQEELEETNRQLEAANEQANRMAVEAQSATRSKSEFLANMSHEIRTPMMAVLGYADVLLEEIICCPVCPDSTHCHQRRSGAEMVATIKRNGEHLLKVIGDILDLSKIEAGKLQIELSRCSPVQLVAEVVSVVCGQAAAKQLELKTELADSLPETVLTDPLRLRQVLVNLLGNAIKFTGQGEVRLAVRLTSDSGTPRLCFDVTDTGIGMNEQQVGKLFQPFTQADSSTTREFGGTGLGLCISKHLAEALGGNIEVRSNPGKGSTFIVSIDPGPLDGMHMIQNAHETLLDRPPARTAATPDKIILDGRILLAEDGLDNQRLIAMLLTKAGAEVTAVENGQLAVLQALAAREQDRPFHAILMDIQMPVLDGYAATRQLRQLGYTGPIIALTANTMAEDCQKCLDAGCNDYATKPIGRQKLLATVALWTARGRTHPDSPDSSISDSQASTTMLPTFVYSDLVADPDLRELVDLFVQDMPNRINALDAHAKSRDWSQLARTAHQIKGAAGSYGFGEITTYAARLETAAMEAQQEQQTLRTLDELVSLCRRVRSGNPKHF